MCSRTGRKFVVLCVPGQEISFVVLCVRGLEGNLLCSVSQDWKEICCAMCPRTGSKFVVLLFCPRTGSKFAVLCVLGLKVNLLCYLS